MHGDEVEMGGTVRRANVNRDGEIIEERGTGKRE